MRVGTMLPSMTPILQLKKVSPQTLVRTREFGATNFFQFFTQRTSRVWGCGESVHIPHEINEILKEDIQLDTSKYRLILVFGGWGRLARALAVPSVH
jgi:hypothetical protein